jgi:hypothetical protein
VSPSSIDPPPSPSTGKLASSGLEAEDFDDPHPPRAVAQTPRHTARKIRAIEKAVL